jgi:hypothetical protein
MAIIVPPLIRRGMIHDRMKTSERDVWTNLIGFLKMRVRCAGNVWELQRVRARDSGRQHKAWGGAQRNPR